VRTIFRYLRSLRPVTLLALSVAASVCITLPIVAVMSTLFRGRVTADYLFTGFVAACVTATIVVSLLLFLFREIQYAERETRRNAEQLRIITDNSRDVIWSLDLVTLKPIYVSPAVKDIIGLTVDEMMDLRLQDILGPADRDNVARFIENIRGKDRETVEGGKNTWDVEWEFRHKDGHMVTLEVTISSIDDASGKPVTLVGVSRDVTERKRMAALLKDNEEKYRNLVEDLNDIVFMTNEQGVIIYVSRSTADAFSIEPQDIVGKNFLDFVYEDDRARVINRFQELSTGILKPYEYRLRSDTDPCHWVRTYSRPVYRDGVFVGVRGVLTDIQDRKMAEEDRERHRAHLELINKILRHDIVNDLGAIRSAVRLYRNDGKDEYLQTIEDYVQRSVSLIAKMRELEQFLLQHRDMRPYSIREVVTETGRNYPSMTVLCPDDCQILADDSLQSVIDNIIGNAEKHGTAKVLSVRVKNKGAFCEVRLADDGTGIPDDIKGRIFDEGYGYGKTAQSGLGLYIVKKAVEHYGGEVAVEDNVPHGTVIVLRLRAV